MDNELITDYDLNNLPEPVQKYIKNCGYIGTSKMKKCKIIWTDVKHKRSIKSNWMKLQYHQLNLISEPTRIVSIQGRIGCIIPIDISEKYESGFGSWQMKLMRVITLINVQDVEELNKTALVTYLSEALLIPSIALQPFIEWQKVDNYTAKAILRHKDIQVSGIFRFNEIGEFIEFETEDRYNSEDGKGYVKTKWIGMCSKYIEKNNIKYPTEFKAIWKTEDNSFEYFNGVITEIVAS